MTQVAKADTAVALVAPVSRAIADWVRKTDLNRTLNDEVEDIHLSLLSNTAYLDLLDPVYDSQAVEGSLAADNICAARIIRDAAIKSGKTKVAKEKLANISKALGIVLRRYGVSRNERRNTLRGEFIAPENGE